MDFLKYPIPVINILNELDKWSLSQNIPFNRKEASSGGFSWVSEYNEYFQFSLHLQLNSPASSKTYSFIISANPKDLIFHDSKIITTLLSINQPYTLDIKKRIIDPLNQEFKSWLDRIHKYENTALFGRVNSQNYEREFYDQFEILEEDASTEPFDHPRQILIEKEVDRVISNLEKFKNENNRLEIEKVIAFGEEVKSQIPKSTKNQLLAKLGKLYGKVREIGATLSMEVLKHFTIELVKHIGSNLLN